MTTSQAARRMLVAILTTVGYAFASPVAAGPSSERLADPAVSADRSASAEQQSDRIANPVQPSTESGHAQDRTIAERVQAALDDDSELKEARLRVNAENGKVRLVGSVSTFEQKDRALEIASAVQGVSGVDDGISLRDRPQPSPADRPQPSPAR